jgi:hypothetical protein
MGLLNQLFDPPRRGVSDTRKVDATANWRWSLLLALILSSWAPAQEDVRSGQPTVRSGKPSVRSGKPSVRSGKPSVRSDVALDRAEWRNERLHVPLTVKVEQVEVLAASGDTWTAAPEAVQEQAGSATVSILADRPYVVRTATVDQLQLTGQKSYLPVKLLYCERDESGRTTGWGWVPFLQVRPDPAQWKSSAYTTELVAGLDTFPDQPPRPLPGPIDIAFFPKGANVQLGSDSLVIEEAGPRGYRSIPVRCTRHDSEPTVVARFGPLGSPTCSFRVHPSLGELRLGVDHPTILGFGFETATLSVSRRAEDGNLWSPPSALEVSLTGEGGLFPASITIPAGQDTAKGELRSRGVGTVRLKITSPQESKPLEVRFAWPLLLLAISLLFGAAGGLLRGVSRIEKEGTAPEDEDTQRSGKRIATSLLVGAAAGFAVVAALASGLATLRFAPTAIVTEAGAAVVALVAGYVGFRGLEWLAKSIGLGPGNA